MIKTLIYHCKLANQIARLVAIVVKKSLHDISFKKIQRKKINSKQS